MRPDHVTPRVLTDLVYGRDGPDLDDPAERFHEAAKISPETLGDEPAGFAAVTADPVLAGIVSRGVRRHAHRRAVELPEPIRLRGRFSALLAGRVSSRSFGEETISLVELATILHAGYGIVSAGTPGRRTVPSGGALYPLELYLVASQIDALRSGVYHYDPPRHVLEELRIGDVDAPARGVHVYPELAEGAALLAVTAVFWRSRFKYGLRGYRFSLLEAGHVMQNVLLASTALRLSAIPVGGVYDRALEALLGVNGVDESVVYCAVVGRPRQAG